MTLDEILQLDKIQSSVKKIDLFVSQKTKYSKEYMKAISFKGLVLFELGKTNDALKLLYEHVPAISSMDSESVISLCSSIIEITISIEAFEQAAKYIKIKQSYLPISRANEYIKDATSLYLARKDYQNAKKALREYLEDDISTDEEIYALEKLSAIYYLEREYDKYLDCIPKLESYYSSILDITHQEEIQKNKIEIAFLKKNWIQVILDGQKFFTEFDASVENHLKIASYMIESYIAVSDYKKASIVESNYEEYISNDYVEESIQFCYAAMNLYNRTNTASSVIEYRNKIEKLESFKKKKQEASPKANKKVKVKKSEEIIIPSLDIEEKTPVFYHEDQNFSPLGVLNPKEEEPIIQTQKVIEDIKAVKNIEVSENYSRLSLIMDAIHNVEYHKKFREAFRIASIEICKQYDIDEIYLLWYDECYKGLHYKKERAYDKKPTLEILEGTLGFDSMQQELELFLDQSDLTYCKNIVTGELYEDDTFAFAIPLFDSIKAIGSITYISHVGFLAYDLCYESLKLISGAMNARLLDSIDREQLLLENQKIRFVNEKMTLGFKENISGYYHFSPKAKEMLGVLDTLTEKDYLLHLDANDAKNYKRAIEELTLLHEETIELEYDFIRDKDILRIKERFYPLLHDGQIEIYSLLEDITAYEDEKKNLVDLAYKNPISNMQTIVKLTTDLQKEYEKKKCSLAILDVIDSKLYKDLYGLNFYNQVIKAIGMKLVSAFENMFTLDIYHLEGTTYALLIRDINDRRIVDSLLKEGLAKCAMDMFHLNHRVKIGFNAGVFRLSKATKLEDISLMISYAADALIDASSMDTVGNHIAHYDSNLSKQRFRENSIVTTISEAIDLGNLSIMYKQIVNMKESSVFAFYLSINMDSFEIEEDEMMRVICRKGMTAQMEKYRIATAFKELKMFYNETKAFVNLFIPVSTETLSERFIEFLQSQQSFFKINPNYITFVCDSIYDTPLMKLKDSDYHLASRDILDIYRGLCDYFIYDYHEVNKESIQEIFDLCSKHNVVCILSGMDLESDIDFVRENGYSLVYGNYYKNRKRMKDILENIIGKKK